jgi:hypothetical protein
VGEKWRGKGHEKAAEHIEEYLSCLAFPESHRKSASAPPADQEALNNQEIKPGRRGW